MPSRSGLTVAILWAAYVFSLVDRQALSLMLEPIRLDLGVSDTAMGLLHGVTFAVFYGLAGLPIAYLVDRRSRRTIVSVGFLSWSLMTAWCGLARDYAMLFAGRVGVAVGEATLLPNANSIIADLYPPASRGRATGAFASAIPVGFGVALFGVGLVYDWARSLDVVLPLVGRLAAWQIVFLILGASGCLLSALPLLIVDPPRTTSRGGGGPADLRAFLKINRRLLILFLGGVGCFAMAAYATLAWFPTLLLREFGWTIRESGLALGIAITIPGLFGTIGGGLAADRIVAGGLADGKLRVCAAVASVAAVPLGFIAIAPSGLAATLALAAFALCAGVLWSVALAAVQDMTPGALRGRLTAGYSAVVNLVGIGVGPVLVGLLTDWVIGDEAAIEWAIAGTAFTMAALSGSLLAAAVPGFRRALGAAAA